MLFGRRKNNSLGQKTKKQIQKIVESWIQNTKKAYTRLCLVVVACNTASIAVREVLPYLQEKHNVPIVTMIEGAKRSMEKHEESIKNKRILIAGTKYTIERHESNVIEKRELYTYGKKVSADNQKEIDENRKLCEECLD